MNAIERIEYLKKIPGPSQAQEDELYLLEKHPSPDDFLRELNKLEPGLRNAKLRDMAVSAAFMELGGL